MSSTKVAKSIPSTFLTGILFCFNEKLPRHPLTKQKVEIKTHYHLLLYI